MKYLLLSAIFLTAGCGKYDYNKMVGSIGESLRVNINSPGFVSDTTTLSRICSALAAKNVSQLVNTTHSFIVNQTDCGGTSVLSDQAVNTIIQSNGGNYYFKRQDNGMDFLFPDVDTSTSGVMASACASLSAGQSVPSFSVLPNGDIQTISTSGFSSADCAPGGNELCVYFQTATLNTSGAYTVHTKEWVKFKTNPQEAKVGFASFRKKITKSYCSQNQFVSYQALLK